MKNWVTKVTGQTIYSTSFWNYPAFVISLVAQSSFNLATNRKKILLHTKEYALSSGVTRSVVWYHWVYIISDCCIRYKYSLILVGIWKSSVENSLDKQGSLESDISSGRPSTNYSPAIYWTRARSNQSTRLLGIPQIKVERIQQSYSNISTANILYAL